MSVRMNPPEGDRILNAHRVLWSNGGRPFLIAGFVTIAATLTLAAASFVLLVLNLRQSEFAPLYGTGYSEVQHIENPVVPVGGVLTVPHVQKCNRTGKAITVTGESHFRRTTPEATVFIPFLQTSALRAPGCTTRTYANTLPPEVGPGTWVLEGAEVASSGDKRQTAGWVTEPFTVVEGAP